MTETELTQAQFLLSCYKNAERLLQSVDKSDKLYGVVENIAGSASRAFFILCRREPSTVIMSELSTLSPAKWAEL